MVTIITFIVLMQTVMEYKKEEQNVEPISFFYNSSSFFDFKKDI